MQTQEYKIHADHLTTVKQKLAVVNRRAVRLGLPEMELVIGDAVTREYWKQPTDLVKRVEVTHMVSVTGEYPTVNGWTLIAKINHEQGENLIDIHSDDDVTEWRDRAPKCDHCNQHRISVKSYLIKNEDGTIMGVGSGCLKDFLPHSTDSMIRMWSLIDDIMGDIEDMEGHWGGGAYYHSAYNILSLAYLCVRKAGFVPATGDGQTTVDRVWRGIQRPMRMDNVEAREWDEFYKVEDQDTAAATAMIEHYKTLDADGNNFVILVKQLLELGAIEGKFVSHITGAMASFLKWKAVESQRAIEAAQEAEIVRLDEWVGEIKKRQDFTVTLESAFKIEGYYGITTICKMRDDAGRALVWFSSTGGFDAEIGDTFTVKATVKSHDTYRDKKQTVITRCKQA